MNRSPLYQTFATRLIVPVRRRSRWPLALATSAAVMLVLTAVLLGRGLTLPQHGYGAKASELGAPGTTREDLLRRYAEQTPTAPPVTNAAEPATVQQRVSGTGGAGLLLREQPGFAGARLVTLDEAAVVELRGDPMVADGIAWLPVRDAAGNEGWVAAEYLQPA